MKIQSFMKGLSLLLLLAAVSPAVASPCPKGNREGDPIQLQNRLEEIRSLNKTKLSQEEKKALRKEVREIKKELAAIDGDVYLSAGVVILIALLLILLL